MTHLHLPDGVLPAWLWIAGLVGAAIVVLATSIAITRQPDARRRVPIVAVTAALIVVAMSVPIVPIAYHVNLSVVAGVILGPIFAPIVALIVQLTLWLMGHGGATTLGLNTLILSLEMVLGWAFTVGLVRLTRGMVSLRWSTALATVVTLALTTTLVLGIVSTIGDTVPAAHDHAGETAAEHEAEHEDAHAAESGETVSLSLYAKTLYTLGPIGWLVEAAVGFVVIGFLASVRPTLLPPSVRRYARRSSRHDDGAPNDAGEA